MSDTGAINVRHGKRERINGGDTLSAMPAKVVKERSTIPIGLRVPPDDLAEIDARAHAFRMTRTEYMVRASLDKLPVTDDVRSRLDEFEKRLSRLESAAFEP